MNARGFRAFVSLSLVCLLASGTIGCSEDENLPLDSMKIKSIEQIEQMEEQGVVTIEMGQVENDFIQSGNPMAAINASLKLALSSFEVTELLELPGTQNTGAPGSGPLCFGVSTAGLSVELDFTGCSNIGLSGKIKVAKHITGLFAGPIVVTFKDGFSIQNVAITGSLGLTRVAGKQLTFRMFTADKDGTQGTPISVEYLEKDVTVTARFDGKVKVSLLTAEVLFWGVASSTFKGVTTTIYVGGVSDDDVAGVNPSADAIVYKLFPFDCYCPSRGVISGQLDLNISEINFDLDDFTSDDGTDDYPSFVIPVNVDSTYTATVRFSECGVMQVALHVEDDKPLDFAVAAELILSALESANDNGIVPDDLMSEMSAIIGGLQGYAASFQISVGDIINTISDSFDLNFYVPFCAV